MMLLLGASEMASKIARLWPEIVVLATAFTVMIVGLSPSAELRRKTVGLSLLGLAIAAVVATYDLVDIYNRGGSLSLGLFVKLAACGVGAMLLVMAAETPDESGTEPEHESNKPFDPGHTSRGEFYGFMLLSLTGLMLTADADSLVWLFLSLELVSLPTYVMVATARKNIRAPEAGVKYFFLGAFAAAVFLYGFALLYGATGYTTFGHDGAGQPIGITKVFAEQGVSNLALAGMILAVVGVCFKIAAVPMHQYAADVYEGAATPVSAFLAFVPKAAGFVALILLLGTIGWPLGAKAPALEAVLWVIAAATMFVGNTLALWQDNVKRLLAYSSVAHSGYMLVPLLAGPGLAANTTGTGVIGNGVGAVLFYLVAYGVMNIGAFAVVGILKRQGEEADTFADLRGLAGRHPMLALVMAVCALSLTGIPPLVGFWGKVYLFGAAISAGYVGLVVLAVINSAIAAVYYLRLVTACYLPDPTVGPSQAEAGRLPWRHVAAGLSAGFVVILSLAAGPVVDAAYQAGSAYRTMPGKAQPQQVEQTPAIESAAKR